MDMLGDAPVLQVYPAYYLGDDFDLLYFVHVYTLPLYRIYRAEREGPALLLTEIDYLRISKDLESNPEVVKHLLIKGRQMLMAPPNQTRKFLLDRMEESDSFWSRKILRMTRIEQDLEPAPEEGAP